jgi:hypothetical protein
MKRILSLILCLLMLFGTATVGGVIASAEDAFYDETTSTLTIRGDGVVTENFVRSNCKYQKLKKVIFDKGSNITGIGDYAFLQCEMLTDITIFDSVTSIGKYAFSSCDSLVNVNLGNGIKSIGEGAFYQCPIESITFPASFEILGKNIFDSCNKLKNISVSSDNPYFSSEEGILFNKNKTELIKYPPQKEGSSYTIPNTVTSIGDRAFYYNKHLTSITIPSNVTNIGKYAFNACTSLTDITISNGVSAISDGAFYGCESLASITIPSSVESIGKYAFELCNNLKDVYFAGTKEEYAEIRIDTGNANLQNATFHYYCSNDSHSFKDGKCTNEGCWFVCNHTGETEIKNKKPATCTNDGFTGDTYCKACGKLMENGDKISASGHSFGDWKVTKSATLFKDGEETRTCTNEGCTEKQTRIINAKLFAFNPNVFGMDILTAILNVLSSLLTSAC